MGREVGSLAMRRHKKSLVYNKKLVELAKWRKI